MVGTSAMNAYSSKSTKNKQNPPPSALKVKVKTSSKTPVTFIATYSESKIVPISLTKAHFLDAYSKVCQFFLFLYSMMKE